MVNDPPHWNVIFCILVIKSTFLLTNQLLHLCDGVFRKFCLVTKTVIICEYNVRMLGWCITQCGMQQGVATQHTCIYILTTHNTILAASKLWIIYLSNSLSHDFKLHVTVWHSKLNFCVNVTNYIGKPAHQLAITTFAVGMVILLLRKCLLSDDSFTLH